MTSRSLEMRPMGRFAKFSTAFDQPSLPVIANKSMKLKLAHLEGGPRAFLANDQSQREQFYKSGGDLRAKIQLDRTNLIREYHRMHSYCKQLWMSQSDLYTYLCNLHNVKRESRRRRYQLEQEQLRHSFFAPRVTSHSLRDSVSPTSHFVSQISNGVQTATDKSDTQLCQANYGGVQMASEHDASPQVDHFSSMPSVKRSPRRNSFDSNLEPSNRTAENLLEDRQLPLSALQKKKRAEDANRLSQMIAQLKFSTYHLNALGEFIPRNALPLTFRTKLPTNIHSYRNKQYLEDEHSQFEEALKRASNFDANLPVILARDLRKQDSVQSDSDSV